MTKNGKEAAICGGLIGVLVGIALAGWIGSGGFPDHDPVKMLQLRTACLESSPASLFTTYCDNYAEEYSRIKVKRP